MLVLGRKIGQRISVSGPCEIVLVHAAGGFARIGIEADEHVQIERPDRAEGDAEEEPTTTTK